MPVSVTCGCGRAFTLKDEFAGRRLACPACGTEIAVPEAAPVAAQADAVFDRDKFLLRQKRLAINEKYFVHDEHDKPIMFVERPAHLLQQIGAAIAAVITLILMGTVTIAVTMAIDSRGLPGWLMAILFFAGIAATVAATVVVAVVASPKRHVGFYRDATRAAPLLAVQQDSRFQPIKATFTVVDDAGAPLAKFSKNVFTNILRKKWRCSAPDGTPICTAMEDSMILALLRRFLGPMFGLLRTNYVFVEGQSRDGTVLGEFNRKFTLFDRYVLDMKGDPGRALDRRVALALGVMLDTGERR